MPKATQLTIETNHKYFGNMGNVLGRGAKQTQSSSPEITPKQGEKRKREYVINKANTVRGPVRRVGRKVGGKKNDSMMMKLARGNTRL